jgi:uncharacterized LabA/DUF88 family protein
VHVFIDGENLRHRLVSVLYQEKLINDRDDIYSVDIHKLVSGALKQEPESIRYFTTNIAQPDFEIPEMLTEKIESIKEAHEHWLKMLHDQGITAVVAGNLKVKQSNRCYHCGRRTMVLQEKGVDVRLAAEVVMAATHDNIKDIVVLSSDADMIPALEIARKGGSRVTYMCFEEEVNEALLKSTDAIVKYDRDHVVRNFIGRHEASHPMRDSHHHHAHEYHGAARG